MVSPINATERKPYQKIADQLRSYIAQGDFKAGSRLPPERDLTQLLGVSRPSLREALIALEIDGDIEIKMGSGVYVRARSTDGKSQAMPLGESPSELMQARALIEGESVILACLHGKKSDHRYLQECIDAMRASIANGLPPLEDDRKFHQRLAKMTGNSALVRIITALFDERHTPISAHLSKHSENALTWEAAVVEHEAILRAVVNKDVLGAQTSMRQHLSRSENRWLQALEPEDNSD
ncbi:MULTISPECIES: FadR/GntR family transcriptional regulator [Pseudomonas]|jgi:GntR family transcriptional repressor for pyruvate dehydrogenase complex|uniref:FadR/GntR family transcriptional regulator n=1 Tax=Pseudomonas TaxID=286 RepID=UPI000344C468|nr:MULTISPECIES: FadR/GntR family transcriptional regulator [Pseudomonas]UVM70101.1 FadR family transcriptional regulator [Pseudomonas canavaninivorans]